MIKVQSRIDFLLFLKQQIPENSLVVEIGVLHGDFSELILNILSPSKLFLVDPYIINENTYSDGLTTSYSTEHDYVSILRRFQSQIYNKQIIIDKNYSYISVNKYTDGTIDAVYLDGSHLYEDVKKDLNDWLPKLKEGSLICGHDYVNISNFGVIQAVDEFCTEHNFEMILFNENGGDWALKSK